MTNKRQPRSHRSWIALVTFALSLSVGFPLLASTSGVGKLHLPTASLRFTYFLPLGRHGGDAVRVSYGPVVGTSWSVELHLRGDHVNGVLVWPVHGRAIGSVLGLGGDPDNYQALVAEIDKIAAASARDAGSETSSHQAADPASALNICTDGAVYVVERYSHGANRWTRFHSCDERGGEEIALLLTKAYPEIACLIGVGPRADDCVPERIEPTPPGQ